MTDSARIRIGARGRLEDEHVTAPVVAEVLGHTVDQHALSDLESWHHRLAGDPDGLTRKAWMPSASPRATATITTSSRNEPAVLFSLVRATRGTEEPRAT